MAVVPFRKKESSIQKALGHFQDMPIDTVLVIARVGKELHYTWAGEATVSEAIGLLAVLQYEIMAGHDGPG